MMGQESKHCHLNWNPRLNSLPTPLILNPTHSPHPLLLPPWVPNLHLQNLNHKLENLPGQIHLPLHTTSLCFPAPLVSENCDISMAKIKSPQRTMKTGYAFSLNVLILNLRGLSVPGSRIARNVNCRVGMTREEEEEASWTGKQRMGMRLWQKKGICSRQRRGSWVPPLRGDIKVPSSFPQERSPFHAFETQIYLRKILHVVKSKLLRSIPTTGYPFSVLVPRIVVCGCIMYVYNHITTSSKFKWNLRSMDTPRPSSKHYTLPLFHSRHLPLPSFTLPVLLSSSQVLVPTFSHTISRRVLRWNTSADYGAPRLLIIVWVLSIMVRNDPGMTETTVLNLSIRRVFRRRVIFSR